MRIVFLHIPKTAGQSIHAALENAFGKQAVCPARVNDQLKQMSISEINRYQVFSGHLDWTLLDCLKGPTYVFTVLREPLDRLLSFYFFLRKQGEQMKSEERQKPGNQGLKAAFELSPNEYFMGGPPHLRNFLDDHYDNFYTYFFAGRHYRARSELIGAYRSGAISRERLLDMARDNLSHLGGVFSVDHIGEVFSVIRDLGPGILKDDEAYRTNVNGAIGPSRRMERLLELGANQRTLDRIDEYCAMDRELWSLYAQRRTAPVATAT